MLFKYNSCWAIYKKNNWFSNAGFGVVLSVLAVKQANLFASKHTAGTLTVP